MLYCLDCPLPYPYTWVIVLSVVYKKRRGSGPSRREPWNLTKLGQGAQIKDTHLETLNLAPISKAYLSGNAGGAKIITIKIEKKKKKEGRKDEGIQPKKVEKE